MRWDPQGRLPSPRGFASRALGREEQGPGRLWEEPGLRQEGSGCGVWDGRAGRGQVGGEGELLSGEGAPEVHLGVILRQDVPSCLVRPPPAFSLLLLND